jgi:hypothetical protein
MTESIGNLSVGIVADDRTEKGAKSAEKRLSQVGKRVGDHNKAIAKETERSLASSSKSILGTMGRVEQGVARALGSKSLTSGLAGRLGAVGEAGSAMAGGLAEAATSGGVLAGAAMGVTSAIGATVGVLGAAAYAAFKFSDSWAKGAASLSRTAETIGVSTKALTEFNAAAERVGVDKGTATGAMGSLSQTLNDARYGRNTQALEVMRRLGVGMKTNADGTVNTEAMLPDIANAISRQNSSGRRTAAGALGIPLAALPAFSQGGKALSADMKNADGTAVVIDDRVGNMARGVARKGVLAGQAFDRTVDYAGRSAAGLMGGKVDDVIVGGMRDFDSAVHGDFKPAVADFSGAVDKFSAAFAQKFNSASGKLTSGGTQSRAAHASFFRDMLMTKYGLSHSDATALAANAEMESRLDPQAHEGGGKHGRGLFQITDRHRKALFRQTMGKDIEGASQDEQIRFAIWEMGHSESSGWKRTQALGTDSPDRAAGYSALIERSGNKYGDARDRAAVAGEMDKIPVHVTVEIKGAPHGAKVHVRAGQGSTPAISHAMTD